MIIIYILAFIGFFVAAYAVSLERNIKGNRSYKPACDISDGISCSKVVNSPYSAIFGISNALLGVIYYALIIFFQAFGFTGMVFYMAALGSLFSLYLAFVLYTRIKTFCVVCTTSYIATFLLLVTSYYQVWGN